MGLLRRLLGRSPDDAAAADEPAGAGRQAPPANAPSSVPSGLGPRPGSDEAERARELELARFDQDRIDDLVRRQQRYADRSWTPPAQGGARRADDEAGGGGSRPG